MGWIENFHFIRPWLLLTLVPALLLWWQLRRNAAVTNQWAGVVDAELLDHLLQREGDSSGQRSGQSRWQQSWFWWVGVGWIVCALGLAGPSWERRDVPTFRNVVERVIVIDLSKSMDAKDIKPSRLLRVRQKVEDILARSDEVENAVVVYAAAPFVVAPLTSDAETIKAMLAALNVDIMPAQGSRTSLALDKAYELLQAVKSKQGQILLFTDSAVDSAAMASAATLTDAGYSLSVIGVGSKDGAPIPGDRAGFLKDRSGNIVVARLDEESLKTLALAGGGAYRPIASDESDIESLLSVNNLSSGSAGGTEEEDKQTIEAWVDRGPWFILLLLPLTAVAFRRGWL